MHIFAVAERVEGGFHLRILFVLLAICVSCVTDILSCLFLAALWSPAGKELTSWISCDVCAISYNGALGKVWYLIVLILNRCLPLYIECLDDFKCISTVSALFTVGALGPVTC